MDNIVSLIQVDKIITNERRGIKVIFEKNRQRSEWMIHNQNEITERQEIQVINTAW